MIKKINGFVAILAPGLIAAATGVGAGDLATGAFAGSHLGLTILWAVVLGAVFKYLVTEGLTRWQLATNTTLLEGAVRHFGKPIQIFFFVYLIIWSFLVGAALMGACGVAANAVFPVFKDPVQGKIILGIAHSIICCFFVLKGGYSFFEKLMKYCIAIMFVTVVYTAFMMSPDITKVATGLIVWKIPDFSVRSISWTVALIGGVGGTLSVLCYGYWIQEKGRDSIEDIKTCRLDLGVSYALTAIFGLSVVIIGSTLDVHGKGAHLLVSLSHNIREAVNPAVMWIFLIGAWAAMFSSLFGLLQAIPYLFADFWRLVRAKESKSLIDVSNLSYKVYLLFLATVPALGLFFSFKQAQKFYSVFGALFLPLLATLLLVMNGRKKFIGEKMRNGPLTSLGLVLTIAFFVVVLFFNLMKNFK